MNVKPIPEEYLWKDGVRNHSLEEQALLDKRLHQLMCPCCDSCSLINVTDHESRDEIVCAICGWKAPIEGARNLEATLTELKCWMAAYKLIGKNGAFVNSDCRRFFHPNENELLRALSSEHVCKVAEFERKLVIEAKSALLAAEMHLGTKRLCELLDDFGVSEIFDRIRGEQV